MSGNCIICDTAYVSAYQCDRITEVLQGDIDENGKYNAPIINYITIDNLCSFCPDNIRSRNQTKISDVMQLSGWIN